MEREREREGRSLARTGTRTRERERSLLCLHLGCCLPPLLAPLSIFFPMSFFLSRLVYFDRFINIKGPSIIIFTVDKHGLVALLKRENAVRYCRCWNSTSSSPLLSSSGSYSINTHKFNSTQLEWFLCAITRVPGVTVPERFS